MLWGFLFSNLNLLLFLIPCTLFYAMYHKIPSSPPENVSWIILGWSLHYNKTLWHVLVSKIIVSIVISDMCFFGFLFTLQTRCFSLFVIISIIFSSVSWKIVLKPFKNIQWRQEIPCAITNWRKNVDNGISQLIQYFSIELYLQLVSFSWKYVTLHGKMDTNAFPLNGVEKRF